MNEATPDRNTQEEPKGFPWVTALLGAGLVVALGLGFYQHSEAVNQRLEIASLQKEIGGVRESFRNAQSGNSQALEVMRQDLDATKKETVAKVGQVQSAARRQAEMAASKMGQSITSTLQQNQEERDKQLAAQIDQIKANAEQATARLTEITSRVGEVKTDVATTRTDLDKTVGELKRVTGDLGVLSGLIATNSKQLQALRELGERDYFEFTFPKGTEVHRLADVTMVVKKVDPKRNRYSVDIVADDKHVEKKDKTVNEPVQFYVPSKAKQPYELVVNQVTKTEIKGYLATPKVKAVASASARR